VLALSLVHDEGQGIPPVPLPSEILWNASSVVSFSKGHVIEYTVLRLLRFVLHLQTFEVDGPKAQFLWVLH